METRWNMTSRWRTLTWDESRSARLPLRRSSDPIFGVCLPPKGNHGLMGILAGWRRYEVMGFNGDGSPKSESGVVAIEE